MSKLYDWTKADQRAKAKFILWVCFNENSPKAHEIGKCIKSYYGKYKEKDGGINTLVNNIFKKYENQIKKAIIYRANVQGDNPPFITLK